MVQLILCHQWFRNWFYAKQTLLPEQIRIEYFIQQLGLNPRCWLIIKLASIFQSHIYLLNSACLSIGTFTHIKMLPLKSHKASTWRIQGCVLSVVHSWESVSFALWRQSKEILSALLALCEGNYRWIPPTKDQWCGTLMFLLVSVWTHSTWAGDLICIDAYLTSLSWFIIKSEWIQVIKYIYESVNGN